jgi:predicted outer membrane repeat protein/parallel beta-helix repeat protein
MKKLIILSFVVLLITATLAPAVVRRVPSHYQTIQAAIDACEDGDVVLVADGRYDKASISGVIHKNKAITVQSENGPKNCIIDGGGEWGFWFYRTGTTACRLEGFTVTNCQYDFGAIYCSQDSSPTIVNCIVTNNGDPGGPLNYRGSAGIRCDTLSSPTISNCIIANNYFCAGYEGFGGGILCDWSCNPTVTNCTIVNNTSCNKGGAIYCKSNCHVKVSNCILWSNSTTEIDLDGVSSASVTYSNVQGGWPGDGNIDADPSFVNASIGDYHLLTNSPCIDAGDPDYVAQSDETDLDGKPRLIGAQIDMGAYELQHPRTLYVDADATGTNDGSSWDNAFNYLQDALAAVVSVDEIRVAQGIYKPAVYVPPPPPPPPPLWFGSSNVEESIEPAIDRTATFQLINGVVIKGGYAGFGEPDPNARDIQLYETILSGDIVGDDEPDFVNYEENSYHVVTGSGCDETAILDGFTITAGNADGSHPNNYGAGMYNYKGSPMLTNCIFSRNSATWGGGMQNSNSSPTLNNCTFSNNSAVNRGGGIFNLDNSSPTLINCTFFGNSADLGGGMQNWDSSPILTNSIFSGNLADDRGGGMENIRSNLTLTNCTFTGNSVRGYGCGVFNLHSSSTFTNCTFSRNTARRSGGIYNYDSGSTLTNCILWENAGNIDALQITLEGDSTMSVKYCDIHYGQETIYVMDSTLEWGEGNISTNPLFANLVGGDYHLLPVSPCINTGDPDYIAEPNETDLDGKPRIIAGRIDMGAYEFNHNPIADAGPNQTVEAQAPWGTTVTLDGYGSSDADCTPGTYDDINDFNWYLLDPCDPNADVLLGSGVIIDCNLSIDEHIIILEVIDRAGASDTNEVTIVVQDTTPPDINCPTDVTLQCPADTSVEANGSATAGDTCGSVAIAHSDQWQPGCGNTGILTRTWTATDECGNSSSCVQTITLMDTNSPEFELYLKPNILWPPNHKMVEITPSWTVSDECDPSPDVSLVSIVAEEGDVTIGDGHTTDDIQIGEDGSIYLRAKRGGTGIRRIYTITYKVVDDCGNVTVRSATVAVPHDLGSDIAPEH